MSADTTVLVVDDEADLADLYTAWLEGEYDLRTAYGGSEALEAFDEDVDVALIDRLMPDMSGDEVLATIRERTDGEDVKVAMVTAVEPDFDILEMGFDDYLVKPIRREELLDAVDRLRSRATYDEKLQEYFALVSKRSALESQKSERELAEHAGYQELDAEVAETREELDEAVAELDTEDFEVALRQLDE